MSWNIWLFYWISEKRQHGSLLRQGHRFSFQTFLSTTLNWSYALVSPNISPYVLVCSAGQAHCLLTGVPHVLHTPHTQFKILVWGFDKPKGLYVLWGTECGLAIQCMDYGDPTCQGWKGWRCCGFKCCCFQQGSRGTQKVLSEHAGWTWRALKRLVDHWFVFKHQLFHCHVLGSELVENCREK